MQTEDTADQDQRQHQELEQEVAQLFERTARQARIQTLDDYLRRDREREFAESGGRMPWAY
jgi:transposase